MKKKGAIVLIICSLFLFFKYISSLYPSIIAMELMKTYSLDGVKLAVLASSYYYSYTFMQLFAGYIIDKFDVRIPAFLAISCIALPMILFANTHEFYVMCLSRGIMGIGAAFATILYMKCAACWTTPKSFALISSLLGTATMLGAAVGGAPIAILFENFGWRTGLIIIAIIGIVISIISLIYLTNKNSLYSEEKQEIGIKNIKSIFIKKENWLLLLYSGFTFSPVAILGGLWGNPFLTSKYSISSPEASWLLSIMFIGLAIGSPFWAIISTKFNIKTSLMHFCNILSILMLIGIIYLNLSYYTTMSLFFIYGFSIGSFMICFQICREYNSVFLMGFAVAFINTGEGIISSTIEPLIGYILDENKVGDSYTLSGYKLALSLLPICFVLSSMTLYGIKIKENSLFSFKKELKPNYNRD